MVPFLHLLLLLPPCYELTPFPVVLQVATKKIVSCSPGLIGASQQAHMSLLKRLTSFLAVAGWAGAHQVLPAVFSPTVAGHDMVHRQLPRFPTTILADIVVPPKDLPTVQFHPRTRPPDHVAQSNHRRARVGGRGRPDIASTIFYHLGLADDEQHHGPLRCADIQGFVV